MSSLTEARESVLETAVGHPGRDDVSEVVAELGKINAVAQDPAVGMLGSEPAEIHGAALHGHGHHRRRHRRN